MIDGFSVFENRKVQQILYSTIIILTIHVCSTNIIYTFTVTITIWCISTIWCYDIYYKYVPD